MLLFRPTRWERQVQRLEITTGDLLPDQEIPLLKTRRELSRAEALMLWEEKRNAGWAPCSPQWCEVDGFYWTDSAPDIVNSGREEQGLFSV